MAITGGRFTGQLYDIAGQALAQQQEMARLAQQRELANAQSFERAIQRPLEQFIRTGERQQERQWKLSDVEATREFEREQAAQREKYEIAGEERRELSQLENERVKSRAAIESNLADYAKNNLTLSPEQQERKDSFNEKHRKIDIDPYSSKAFKLRSHLALDFQEAAIVPNQRIQTPDQLMAQEMTQPDETGTRYSKGPSGWKPHLPASRDLETTKQQNLYNALDKTANIIEKMNLGPEAAARMINGISRSNGGEDIVSAEDIEEGRSGGGTRGTRGGGLSDLSLKDLSDAIDNAVKAGGTDPDTGKPLRSLEQAEEIVFARRSRLKALLESEAASSKRQRLERKIGGLSPGQQFVVPSEFPQSLLAPQTSQIAAPVISPEMATNQVPPTVPRETLPQSQPIGGPPVFGVPAQNIPPKELQEALRLQEILKREQAAEVVRPSTTPEEIARAEVNRELAEMGFPGTATETTQKLPSDEELKEIAVLYDPKTSQEERRRIAKKRLDRERAARQAKAKEMDVLETLWSQPSATITEALKTIPNVKNRFKVQAELQDRIHGRKAVRVDNLEEAKVLEPGTLFVTPDGEKRRKT